MYVADTASLGRSARTLCRRIDYRQAMKIKRGQALHDMRIGRVFPHQ
jgi:hypothetical protein